MVFAYRAGGGLQQAGGGVVERVSQWSVVMAQWRVHRGSLVLQPVSGAHSRDGGATEAGSIAWAYPCLPCNVRLCTAARPSLSRRR